ncbi:MAG: chorismate mutase [Pyrinomonadaceae bacterium]
MLDECRKTIDEIDTEILILLNRRATVAKKIGTIKLQAGLPLVDGDREAAVIRKIVRENQGSLGDDAAARIYSEIIRETRQIQIDLAESVERNGQI